MTGMHHKRPGVVGGVLTCDAVTTEIIGDGYHVHSAAMNVVLRCKGAERVALITDESWLAGLPDGRYPREDGPALVKKNGVCRMEGALNELSRISPAMDAIWSVEAQIRALAEEYAGCTRGLVVGGGPNWATAQEIALKFKESVPLAAEGVEVEDSLHGPLPCIDSSTLVIGLSVAGPSYDKVGNLLKCASLVGARCVSITTVPYDLPNVDTVKVSIPTCSFTIARSPGAITPMVQSVVILSTVRQEHRFPKWPTNQATSTRQVRQEGQKKNVCA